MLRGSARARLLLTGVVFGVALGVLYSIALGFSSSHHLSELQRPRHRHRHRRSATSLERHQHRGARGARTDDAPGHRGVEGDAQAEGAGVAVVRRPEVREEDLVDPRAIVVSRPQDVALALAARGELAEEGQAQASDRRGLVTEGGKGEEAIVEEGGGGGDGREREASGDAAEEADAGAGAGAGAGVSDAGEDVALPLPRVCGSPAVDGYAHVDPKCLENSPTNKLWWKTHPGGGKSGEGLECNIEDNASLDGLAVGWGIGNKKSSPEECCQACRDHVPGPHVGGPFGNLPCNVWVFCNAPKCYEADAHSHSQGDCWLKFSEAPQSPEVNARGDFSPEFRQRHPDAPPRCQWVSGVLLPPGQKLTNGTWGPRYHW